MTRVARRAGATVALGAAIFGCELIAGIEPFVPAPDGDDGGGLDDASGVLVATSDEGCPSTGRGPRMVRLGGFCIDATEVTVEHYNAFLRDDPGPQPAFCTWNQSYVPGERVGATPQCFQGFARAPVACVDFCDAFMFCAWAGKRLCGDPNGGAASFAEPDDPRRSAWYAACAGDGEPQRAFPYGDTYDPRACNGHAQSGGAAAVAGGLRACQHDDAGVFDLSGNVWEWEDATEPVDGGPGPASDLARIRGGSYTDEEGQLHCAAREAQPRDFQQYNVGFRCCANAR